MRLLLATLLLASGIAAAQDRSTFTGIITDSACADANHSRMRMGDTDAECVAACVDAHGASYVLYDGTVTYGLSDQQAPTVWAGKRVQVTGTLDAKTKTIAVRAIAAS